LKRSALAGAILLLAAGGWLVLSSRVAQREWTASSRAALRLPTGQPQLVSRTALPVPEGEICQWVPASASGSLAVSPWQEERAARAAGDVPRVDADREPVRAIKDSYPTYSAIAVDINSNEVYLQDENLFGVKVFNRLDNTPPTAAFTEPKRSIGGINTKLEFNCGLYVDQRTGDLYSVNNDTVDTMVVFPRNAEGNAFPMRELTTPHGTFGIAVDEENQELYLTVEHDNAVVVYRKMSEGEETPLRLLQGDNTQLADPHGIVLDTRNGWMFVGNHGSTHRVEGENEKPNWPLDRDRMIRGSGRLLPPSITVYPLKASGDTAPLRVIQGPRTQLNWPSNMSVDEERGEIYVANDPDHSILVFKVTDEGDVAPTRVIKGPKTGLQNPTGVFVDLKNDEVWVSNMGNHSATVYSRTADGDAAPLRTIRSAPSGKHALMIGNPGAVEYDSKRDEILVPN
jgi:DNA-binding beta-propeller fold protein YncE